MVALAAAAFSSPAAGQEPARANSPYPPFRIGEGLYYVGADDYASYLIVTKAGLIVIDGGDRRPAGRWCRTSAPSASIRRR